MDINVKSMQELSVLAASSITGNETILLSNAQTVAIATLATVFGVAQQNYSNVENLPVVSATDIANKTYSRVYITYDTLLAALNSLGNQLTSSQLAALIAHLTDYNNPHQVTSAQVGLGNVADYPPVSSTDIADGNFIKAYMTYDQLKSAIQSLNLSFTIPTLNGTAVDILSGTSVELSVSIASNNGYSMATTQIEFQMINLSAGQTSWSTVSIQPYNASTVDYTFTISGLNTSDVYGFQAVLTDTANPDLNVVSSGGNTTLYQPSGQVDVFDIAGNASSLTVSPFDSTTVETGPNVIFDNNQALALDVDSIARIATITDPTSNAFLGLRSTVRVIPQNRLAANTGNSTSKFYITNEADLLTGDLIALVVNGALVNYTLGTNINLVTETDALPSYFASGKQNTQNKLKETLGLTDVYKDLQSTAGMLPVSGWNGAPVDAGNFVYYLGGYTYQDQANFQGSMEEISTIYAAPVNADGSLGTWFLAGYLPYPTSGVQGIASNGTLYAIGVTNPTTDKYTDVWSATINSDGSLSNWVQQKYSLPAASSTIDGTQFATTVLLQGGAIADPSAAWVDGLTVWLIGGFYGATVQGRDQVQCAPINSDGSIGPWVFATNNLPSSTVVQTALSVYQGYAFSYAARTSNFVNGSALNANYSSPIVSQDQVGAVNPGYLPSGSGLKGYQGAMALANKYYAYALGGIDGSATAYANVLSTPLDSEGLGDWGGSWTDTNNNLPAAIAYGKAIILGNYAYVIGGLNGSTVSSAIYQAPVNADGTLGAWTTLTNTLPQGIQRFGLVQIGSMLYTIGGYTDSSATVPIANVYMATIATDGSLSAWSDSGVSLPVGLGDPGAVVLGSALYVLGGTSSGGASSAIYYSAISSNDTLGAWTTNATGIFAAAGIKYAFAFGSTIVYTPLGTAAAPLYAATITASGSVNAFASSYSGTGSSSTTYPVGWVINENRLIVLDTSTYGGIFTFVPNIQIPSSWTTLSNTMPSSIGSWHCPVGWAYNGSVYMMETYQDSASGGTVYLGEVYSATLNASGVLGNWTSVGNLIPDPITTLNGWNEAGYFGFDWAFVKPTGTYVNILGCHTLSSSGSSTGNIAPYYALEASYNSSNVLSDFTVSGNLLAHGVRYGLPIRFNDTVHLYSEWGGHQISTIDSAGTPGPWTDATGRLEVPLSEFTMVAYNGYSYLIGGQVQNILGELTPSAEVYVSSIGSTPGTVSKPVATTPLPQALYNASAIVNNGYLYVVGGNINSNTASTAVYYAPINTDGTLGAWNTNTNVLPSAIQSATLAVNGGNLYVFGGAIYSGVGVNTIYYGAINSSTGAIGAWTTNANNLPQTMTNPGIMFGTSTVYIVGYNGGTNSVYSATLSSGAIGAFSSYSGFSSVTNNNSAGHWFYMGTDTTNSTNPNNLVVIGLNNSGITPTWTVFSFYIDSNDALQQVAGQTYDMGYATENNSDNVYSVSYEYRGIGAALYNGTIVFHARFIIPVTGRSANTNAYMTGALSYTAAGTLTMTADNLPFNIDLTDVCEYNGTYYLLDSSNLVVYEMTPDSAGNPTAWSKSTNQPATGAPYEFNSVCWIFVAYDSIYIYVSNDSGAVDYQSYAAYTPMVYQATFDSSGVMGAWTAMDTSSWLPGIYNFVGVDDEGLLLSFLPSADINSNNVSTPLS